MCHSAVLLSLAATDMMWDISPSPLSTTNTGKADAKLTVQSWYEKLYDVYHNECNIDY